MGDDPNRPYSIGDSGAVYDASGHEVFTVPLAIADRHGDAIVAAMNAEAGKTVTELTALAESGNTEIDHEKADEAVAKFLRTLGHNDVADAYERVEKWFA